MFKSAATKIAHNSTLPALGGNRDLRPLQDLITAEKTVLQSLQRLSNDVSKSNEYLRHWGTGEGDDLQDVLSASSALLGHLSSGLLQLAHHQTSIREHMKAIRSREEGLDELRRRRKAVHAKAETAEKRLSKMSPEHKNLQQQTELLNNLREQMRNLDWEIQQEEAELRDFKRTSTKNWMMLKFGGILELAETATIVGEMGKLIIEEIPLEKTQPGQPTSFYAGHDQTDKLVAEAQRCISEVVFDPQPVSTSFSRSSPVPNEKRGSIDGLPSAGPLDPSAHLQDSHMTSGSSFGPAADEFGGLGDHRASRGFGTMPMPGGPIRFSDDGSRLTSTVSEGNSSSFGSSMTSPGSVPTSRFGGGQFSTFPARKASLPGPGLGPTSPPVNQGLNLQPMDEGSGLSSSFAAEIADALAYAETDNQAVPVRGKSSLDGPAPSYESHALSVPVMSSGLPRGAAPPTSDHNPWDGVRSSPLPAPPPTHHVNDPNINGPPLPPTNSHHIRESATSTDDEETTLPYASPPNAEYQLPQSSDSPPIRRVHFNGGGQPEQEASGHDQTIDNQPSHERIPSYPSVNDVDANNAAAAREVAREMDMLVFSPPPGPPPGHTDIRVPSPLQPPVPPFAQQQRTGVLPDYGETLSPRSEGEFRGSNTDLRSQPPAPNTEAPNPPSINNVPPSPNTTHQTRPSMSINVHSPSPSYSFNSGASSTYGTLPEMPAVQPLRTGSPASPMLTPGARTISAAAFKRSGMRTASGGQAPDGRSLPDVTPLALRKKGGGGPSLPSSPHPGSREALSSSSQGQDTPNLQQEDDYPNGPAPDYESTYEVVPSYGEPTGNAGQEPRANRERAGSAGYGRGQFATNLDGEGLR